MSPSAARDVLVGREAEREHLAGFAARARRGAAVLMIEGPAGIGKTALWSSARLDAAEEGLRVLSCRAVEAEAQLPFAGLAALFEPVPDAALAGLPEPQRHALEVALQRDEARGSAAAPLAVGLGALGALRRLALERPVLVAVDDAPSLDGDTARALGFVLRRLEDERIGALLTRRVDPPLEAPAVPLTDGLPPGRLQRLGLSSLSPDELGRLVRTRLGTALAKGDLVRLHRACQGNPLFALELVRSAETRGGPLRIRELPAVPDRLATLLRDRLERLAPGARAAAVVVSSLTEPTRSVVEAALGPTAQDDLAAAVRAAVIAPEGHRLRLTHPLLASVLQSWVPPDERREAHRRLAGLVRDPEERVRQLALATEAPDERVAAALESAAARAYRRGAVEAAHELADRARALTPANRGEDARRRATQAAEYLLEGGGTRSAAALLETVAAASPAGTERARALARLAWARAYNDNLRVADVLEAARAEAGDDASARTEIDGLLAWRCHMRGDLAAALGHARSSLRFARRLDDLGALAVALADVAFLEFVMTGRIDRAAMDRALALERASGRLRIAGRPSWIWGMLLEFAGDLDGARAVLEPRYRWAAERGDENALPYIASHLSRVETRAGRWALAHRLAEESYEATLQSELLPERAFSLCARAVVEAHLGHVEALRNTVSEGLELADHTGMLPARLELLGCLGLLELSRGDAEAAHRHHDQALRAMRESGLREPTIFRVHANEAEALLALGRVDEAQVLIDELAGHGRAHGRPWALSTAARGRALVLTALGDREGAVRATDEALAEGARLGEPFERARTLLVRGAIERRGKQKRAARGYLDQALASFDELGAALWSERARAELARVGGRTAATGRLTPTEAQVAELVAAGRSNREVADALFMSAKTVEWNLSKVYRKLGIRSRMQLAGSLGSEGDAPPGR